MAQLYQYAVIRKEPPLKVLVDVTSIVAENEAEARIVAARAIPADAVTDLTGVTILVRGFQ